MGESHFAAMFLVGMYVFILAQLLAAYFGIKHRDNL